MTLLTKAKEIITDSIKSVIFIDENALEAYKSKSPQQIPEEILSINLEQNFKKKGITLTSHKFKPSDLNDVELKNYLFRRRDLVLLDWRLEGASSGELYSLKILSDIVKTEHLHFCSIYTTEQNTDSIFNNIESFFSGYSREYYDNIIESLEPYYDRANPAPFNQIDTNPSNNGQLFSTFKEISEDLPKEIKHITSINDFSLALVQVKHALSQFHKSDIPNDFPLKIDRLNNTFIINNTIVTIIPKSENSATKIISKLTHQVLKSDTYFSQLIGLDMQNAFSSQASFINKNLLTTSAETLMYHRKLLISKKLEGEFDNFLKEVMIENAKLTLDESKLKILDNDFLEKISKKRYKISESEIAKLNTFYNGVYIKNKHSLSFGDIFLDEGSSEYYLCITALCDCFYPENINNNFFFVKGTKIKNLSTAINSGDSWFKSFINSDTCIMWSEDVDYIKPIQLHIANTELVNQQITAKVIKNNECIENTLKYLFTLKSSYCQRITNHAYNYPIRVGVDFVKAN